MRTLALLSFALLGCSNGKGSMFDSGSTPDDAGINDSSNPMFEETGALDASDAAFDGKPFAPNLVPNGDFEKGNTSFSSDYAYAMTNTNEGQYTVGTNGQAFNGALVANGDHTSGKGQMFIGNGKPTPDRVWYTSSIPVAPNTNYYFEAFVMNLCCTPQSGIGDGVNPVGPSQLSFYANGQLLGTRTSMKLGVWEGLTTMWNSGAATTVSLQLVNAETVALGNDFAVDDIYLGTISTVNPPK